MKIQQAMFEASLQFDLQRMPELFCGFTRSTDEAPVPYPLACAPQAWAAGAVLLSYRPDSVCRSTDATGARLLSASRLLDGLEELSIYGLSVGDAHVDLRIVQHGPSVGVQVLSRHGTVDVVVT